MWAPRQWGVGTLVCEGTWEPLPHFVGEKTEAQRETASPRSRDDLMVEAVCGLQGGGAQLRTHCPGAASPRQPCAFTDAVHAGPGVGASICGTGRGLFAGQVVRLPPPQERGTEGGECKGLG